MLTHISSCISYFVWRIKRVLDFIKLAWNDHDFNFLFILRLEKFKLKKLLEVCKLSPYKCDIKDISLCIKLIDIIIGEDCSYKEDSDLRMIPLKYINIKNAKRFLSKSNYEDLIIFLNFYNEDFNLIYAIKDELRISKAWNLYCQIRKDKFMFWQY